MTDCLFCKLVAGDIPSAKVYEDDATLAFMDIAPVVPGHTLVIPKAHFDPVTQTPDDVLARVIATVRRVAAAQMSALNADGVNIHQSNGASAGQVVPHVHFHVIPRFADDGHHWNWSAGSYRDPAEMSVLAGRLRQACDA